ncbi:hypothetical protein L3V77_05075 [Vibrio sp. DW001]|uniref:hypothetical protein n=1 Tax=Vibrio sp. DW001 TaxID=2912315 RepID=UPI0023B1F748|nr:hypothetical protein [Vibrio sp. DW001]WED27610.1 hypothetical protein L3V77_05075 [Vibrio sp. DW001]
MKSLTTLLALLSIFAIAQATELESLPEGTMGILTVENMTEGQLFWMKGRVGEGKYTSVDAQNRHCSMTVPIAIGGFADTRLGVHSVQGLTIAITNQELSDALMSGQRIHSEDWVIRAAMEAEPADGYIISGIETTEQFILNSRRRWISWLLDDTPRLTCL